MPFVVPQAFAGSIPPSVDIPTNIISVVVEPGLSTSSIVVACRDPTVTGASITGNLFEIDDSPDFSSVDVSKFDLFCDGGTNNIINTPFLTDLRPYYVRLTVFTDIAVSNPSDLINEYFPGADFLQPEGAIIILKDKSPGLYTIQFRDIGVTNNIGPDIAFTTKPATLIVTDHNANIDLSTAEKIIVQINGVDTVQEETGVNTGIFKGPVPPGASVSYNPGVLGVARATIVIDFDVVAGDPDGIGDIIIEDVQLSDDEIANGVDGISPVNHPVKISFDNGGKVKDGTDISVEMSWADADIHLVADSDIGLPLVFFAADEMFFDADGSGGFDVGETVYKDVDSDGFVSIGDIRLANAAAAGSYLDGSVVESGDSYEGNPLTSFPFESYYDANTSGTFDVGETVYSDLAFDGSVGIADIRLANAATIGFADGSPVFGADDPLSLQMYYASPGSGYEVITQPSDTDKYNVPAKTVKSNTCVLPCNTKDGKYVLGYDLGSGGGGGGGISKAGFVVNALAGLGGASSSGGGNSPPSFGPTTFAILAGGEEGFGGIINDNDAKTLEQTKTFKVGEKAVLRFDYTEGGGIGKIEHIGLYMNVRDGQKRQDSDAYIFYDPLKSPQVTVHDPNGLFSEVKVDLLPKDATNFVFKVELTFAKPMAKSDLILEGWNTQKWSSISKTQNAIEVISSGIVQETSSDQIAETFTEDITNDQVIPVWIKTNAKWWSDDTIDNDTFVSGIEYLVNEGIIKVTLPDSSSNASVSELQPWIKNTAGWWADDMISNDEFLDAIEWLISNDIIQVV